jgi:hypothetical protein
MNCPRCVATNWWLTWNIIQMDKRMIGGGPGLLEPYVDAILTEPGALPVY